MFIISAYAPPTFLKPCLVWKTCECDLGTHTVGTWVEALHADHAISIAHGEHKGAWFLMQEHQSWADGQEYHVHLAEQLQNGVGREKWEAGYEPYLGLLEQFQNAPQWEPLPRLGKGE